MVKTRRALWYVLRSKKWKKYLETHTLNIDFMKKNEPMRAALLEAAKTATSGTLGVHVHDYIYDLWDFISGDDSLNWKFVCRVMDELDDLEIYHKNNGTWDDII